MQIVVPVDEAKERFTKALDFYKEREQHYKNAYKEKNQKETNKIRNMPWYKKMFYGDNRFVGFHEQLMACKYSAKKEYCESQIDTLNTLSSLSRVQLNQKDLDILLM